MNYIQCFFVNSFDEKPVKVGPVKRIFAHKDADGKMAISCIRTYYYDHPEAPGEAFLTVDRQDVIIGNITESSPEYSMAITLMNAEMSAKSMFVYHDYMKKNPVTETK